MIIVPTCPRPDGASYLEQTISDIDESARGRREILVDADSGEIDLSGSKFVEWRIRHLRSWSEPHPAGENKWVVWQALRIAIQRNEDLILLQDDLHLARGAAVWMEDFPVPADLAWVSFYAPQGDALMVPSLARWHCQHFNYCQALKIPLRTLRALREPEIVREMAVHRMGGDDETLRHFGDRFDWKFGVIYPGPVQHVGAVSAVGNGDLRSMSRYSRAFSGRDFDFRNLPYSLYR